MYITILGRQPALGMAELEMLYSAQNVRWFSDISGIVESNDFNFERLGGSQKAGRIVSELSGDWRRVSMKVVSAYTQAWSDFDGKITLGISAYGFSKISPRDVQKTGIILKGKLKEQGVSLRLIPNAETALSTATSHHNKLGLSDNHVELLIVRAPNGNVIVAESVGAQNITALAARDQGRPKRDAFVGMLPPKLARMMVNYTGLTAGRVLDPFCGTGVLLQEAALLGFDVYGSDLVDKMVDFTSANLTWLKDTYPITSNVSVEPGDAMTHRWQAPIDAVACETYLGQPFSAPPSPSKLTEVRGNCNHIISAFLKNIAGQLESGTPLCVAIPAWRDATGTVTHLPLIENLEALGYTHRKLTHARHHELIYYREDQVVARELLFLEKM
jgi:tRNA (guanine10-N2)-dimethyltransferase